MGKLTKEKQLEIAFITIFSVLVLVIFYTQISMNGVVLGNDPAVHLEKAQIFLQTGKVPLVNLGWTPPLYELILAMLISISGATAVGEQIFLVKALAVIVDWLLFLSVYLIGRKFFNRKVGAVAAVLLLMCVPIYEANAWGGYTTVLGITFILFVLLSLTQAVEQFGYLVVTFLSAFALVLSHQLAAFLAVIMLPPILVYMLIKSRGAYLKVVVALILGGGVAFFLYYIQAMLPYLGLVIEYVFYAQKSYAYEIPAAYFSAFLVNFGFILFFALSGIFVSYYLLKRQKKLIFYAILMISFFVPLFFAESYLLGLYMPFEWFIYYLTPPMAILAAVSVIFIQEKLTVYYAKNKKIFRKNLLTIATVSLVVLICLMLVFRSNTVYGKIMQASVFYSTTDIKAYDAGVWLNQNYPGNATVVVTQTPGDWYSVFSNKTVIAQTSATEGANAIAQSVLSLSYTIQDPQTSLIAYEAKGGITNEIYTPINQVWDRVSYNSAEGDFLSFTQNGTSYKFSLSDLNREIYYNNQSYPNQIALIYSNNYVALTQTMVVQNDSYPINVSWAVTPQESSISNVTLYLTNYFDFDFDKAQIPQLMNWVSPWNVTSKTTEGTQWCVVSFTNSTLQDHYIGLYDDKNQLACAFNFADLPDWGNIGCLASGQIDAVRFQYQFSQIGLNQTVTRQYQVLTLSKNSFPALQQNGLETLFNYQPGQFTITSSNFKEYISEYNIAFIVYDKNQLDPNIARCKFLQQIYSNDRYVIFKILSNYNQTQ
jgi:asparagine N-glycosylation enzyme membrane subunit Stt3